MLTAVEFKNYRLLRDVRLELGRLNVIVGRNGIGKSTVLEGVELPTKFLNQPAAENPPSLVALVQTVFRSDAARTAMVSSGTSSEATVVWTNGDEKVGFRSSKSEGQTVWRNQDWWGVESKYLSFRKGSSNKEQMVLETRAVRSTLDASLISSPAVADSETPRINPDGSGIAPLLQYIQGLRNGVFECIEQDFNTVVPHALRLRVLPAKVPTTDWVEFAIDGVQTHHQRNGETIGARFEVDWKDVGWIPAKQLSEGTLLALGLVTLLRHDPPDILLLDDIDKALHPMAQKEVIRLLRRILEQNPDLQIIATAHSPFVLDELSADEVFVAGSAGPGATQIRRLDAHPAWERNKDYLSPGEFWTSVGEDWVGPEPEKASAK